MTLDEIDELAAGMGVSVPALDGFDDAIADMPKFPVLSVLHMITKGASIS